MSQPPSGSNLTFESWLGFPMRARRASPALGCAAGKSSPVSSADIRRLKAVVQDRNAPQKHVWRAEIVLLTADGVGTNEIMRRTAKSKTCVWRWQERFVEETDLDGLVRDKTRPSRIKPLSAEAAERVVALTLGGDPPGEITDPLGPEPRWRRRLLKAQRHRVRSNASGAPAWSATARDAPVQAVHRSARRRPFARRRRALCRSARTRHRPVGRRK